MRFLESMDFSTDEITDMSYAVEVDRQAPADFAKNWVSKNAARVDGWITGRAK